jgi:septum formation protein
MKGFSMKQLILASHSPRRKQLLKELGVTFEIGENTFTEPEHKNGSPQKHVIENALGKAFSAAAKYKDAIIIGADTEVVFNRKVLGKPKNMNEAASFMRMLQGKTHAVYTGLALIDNKNNRALTDYVKTLVTMRRLNDTELKAYLALINPLDKAGAYAIQGPGSIVVEKIDGCYYNVVGFPIAKLEDMMLSLGTSLFQYMRKEIKLEN